METIISSLPISVCASVDFHTESKQVKTYGLLVNGKVNLWLLDLVHTLIDEEILCFDSEQLQLTRFHPGVILEDLLIGQIIQTQMFLQSFNGLLIWLRHQPLRRKEESRSRSTEQPRSRYAASFNEDSSSHHAVVVASSLLTEWCRVTSGPLPRGKSHSQSSW